MYDLSLVKGYRARLKIPSNRIAIPIQKSFLPDYHLDTKTKNAIGNFYEILTTGFFGGRSHNPENLGGLMCVPDYTDHDLMVHYESKGVSVRGDCKLHDLQTRKYALIQMGKGRFRKPTIRYLIYLHGVKDIIDKTRGEIPQVVSELAGNTLLALSLPFSVIWSIHEQRNFRAEYHRMNNGHKITSPMTRFRPGEIFRFAINPVTSLESFGLKPDRYSFRRVRVPEGVYVNDSLLAEFPILFVHDADHASWLRSFKRKHLKELEAIVTQIADEEGVDSEQDYEDFVGSLFYKPEKHKKPKKKKVESDVPF